MERQSGGKPTFQIMTTKTQSLIDKLALQRPALNAGVAGAYVKDFLSLVKQELEAGNSVSLDRVGVIKLRLGSTRFGRNMKTGERIIIAPRVRAKLVLNRDLIIYKLAL